MKVTTLTGWYVRMRTSYHLMLLKPIWTQWTKKAQRDHTLLRVENVVYYAFELEPAKARETYKIL